MNPHSIVAKAKALPTMSGLDLVKDVTCKEPYHWREGDWDLEKGYAMNPASSKYKVVAYDYGIKRNILRLITSAGCDVTVVPATMPAEEVLAMNPDGIFLSNGPGDPEPVAYAIESIRKLLGRKPIFGICLGHQLLGLALGARTFKLKFGHRGANQPVLNQLTNRVEITTQNHGFAVRLDDLPRDLEPTHVNLNDHTLEGMRHRRLPVFSVQYHPEASAGPHDSSYLFEEFRKLMG